MLVLILLFERYILLLICILRQQMNNRGGNGKGKARPIRGRPRMSPPRKLKQRNLICQPSLAPYQPSALTKIVASAHPVAPALTSSSIHASTPESFVFMPTSGTNLQTKRMKMRWVKGQFLLSCQWEMLMGRSLYDLMLKGKFKHSTILC